MIVVMDDASGWRCPLCGSTAAGVSEHLRTEHGIGGARDDRFGLREATRPPAGRSGRRAGSPGRRLRAVGVDEDVRPARPAPLPPDAAVLRLVCESLEGSTLPELQARLADLAGVESVAVDLYERTVDLFLDRRRAAPPHLVTMATERLGLPTLSAELHRAPPVGSKLGPDTLLLIVR